MCRSIGNCVREMNSLKEVFSISRSLLSGKFYEESVILRILLSNNFLSSFEELFSRWLSVRGKILICGIFIKKFVTLLNEIVHRRLLLVKRVWTLRTETAPSSIYGCFERFWTRRALNGQFKRCSAASNVEWTHRALFGHFEHFRLLQAFTATSSMNRRFERERSLRA